MFLASFISAPKCANHDWPDGRTATRDLHEARKMVEEEAELLEAEIDHLKRQVASLRAFVQRRKGPAPRSFE
jgi:hypothetical protein